MTIPRLQPKRLHAAASDRGGGSGASAIARTQRAIRILRLLQAGQVWSPQELAVQFKCSTRTIFRDVQLLRDCDIPIENLRGERGFKLSHDFFWHPERPTFDEMTALVVGARLAEETLPHQMQKNLGWALTKLVGSERPAVRQRLSELTMRIDPPHADSPPALPALDFLPQLLAQIGNQAPLVIVAAADARDDPPRRLLWIPVRLHFGDGQWHLIGLPLGGDQPLGGGQEQSLPLAAIQRLEASADDEPAAAGGVSMPPAAAVSSKVVLMETT
ncbi:MAG: HTH domain-containing protein [Planctomycetaceae bacterium]|nr:HTH domain-containing protein [Planctomycetaceae bacterium]